MTTPVTADDFSTTVFLGDSLTAGFQSGSLLDTAEVNGWAPLVAKQASFSIVQALIAAPGAPATLVLDSVSPLKISTASGITTGRDNPTVQVTDLAVPGAELNDILTTVPTAAPTTDDEIATQLVLGYPGLAQRVADSQTTFAIKANPTTIFVWAGNNDAFIADTHGTPAALTTLADFTTQYTSLISQLSSQTKAHLVVGNIPDVTTIPYLEPATAVLAQYAASTGLSTTALGELFGIAAGDLVTPEGLDEISAIAAGTQTTTVSDAGVLTAAEVLVVQQRVTDFNTVIAAQAKAAGATLVDLYTVFHTMATSGVTIGGYTGTSAFLGGFFSLDGIHPTNTGYAVIANAFIDAINAEYTTKIADVNLTTVAAADPLWPPNLPKTAAAVRPGLHGDAARRFSKMLSHEGR